MAAKAAAVWGRVSSGEELHLGGDLGNRLLCWLAAAVLASER
jgi:hypothetical protein